MKNILVIGGSYFSGRVFVETLAGLPEYAVSVFNRGNIPLHMDRIEQIKGDREILEHVALRIPGKHWDAVVDFCAYSPDHITTLLEGLSGTVDHYVFISSTSVYKSESKRPVDENAAKITSSQPELGEFADYGLNKVRAEQALKTICGNLGISYTILRPAIIYGRYNYAPRESYFFDSVINGSPLVIPGRAPALFSFVWVEDLAELILRCVQKKVEGQSAEYNVAGPEALSYSDLINVIEKVCERRPLVKKMALPQIARENISPPFPPDIDLHYDGRKIADALAYKYTPFIMGMRQTWEFYRAGVTQRNNQATEH